MEKTMLSDALQLAILDDLYTIYPLTLTRHGFMARFGEPEAPRLIANVRQLIADRLVLSGAIASQDEQEYIEVAKLQLTLSGYQFVATNPPVREAQNC